MYLKVGESEEIAMMSTQLASKFLFSVGLHTKKTLRGPAQEWYDALQVSVEFYLYYIETKMTGSILIPLY